MSRLTADKVTRRKTQRGAARRRWMHTRGLQTEGTGGGARITNACVRVCVRTCSDDRDEFSSSVLCTPIVGIDLRNKQPRGEREGQPSDQKTAIAAHPPDTRRMATSNGRGGAWGLDFVLDA